MKGLLFDFIVNEDPPEIAVFLDRDHPYVKEAQKQRTPLAEKCLAALLMPGIVSAILSGSPSFQRKVLRRTVRLALEEREDDPRRLSMLMAHFLTHYNGPVREVA
jgi:hypothetical protein